MPYAPGFEPIREYPEGFEPIQTQAQSNGGWPDALSFMGQGVRYEPVQTPDGLVDIRETPAPTGPMALLSILGGAGGAALARAAQAGRLLESAGGIFGGTVGGEIGGQMQGERPGAGAVFGGVSSTIGEGLGALWQFLRNSGMGAKANINEVQSRSLADVIGAVNPSVGEAVSASRGGVSPLLRGGKTAASMQEAALGQSGKLAASDAMESGLLDASLANAGQGIVSPALITAWRRLPNGLDAAGNVVDDLAYKTWRELAPSPAGTFSVNQAEGLLMRLGDAAFKGEAASPIARGVGGYELRRLYEQAVQDTTAGQGGPIIESTRREFAGGNALLEALRQGQAFQGLPNRVFLNTPAVQKYVSDNRAELEAKLGDEGYRKLLEAIYAGGQIGTRDILTPGSGEAVNALRQVYGRGQGGAPQIVGSAARTVFPNLGADMTGRGFFRMDPGTRALLDYLGTETAKRAVDPTKQYVPIGPMP